ncbi:MlaD family protein [Roseibium salinum]|uniref:MlaD family protein n=1 Tax=Roseibium salinum TaxID=1604349 RepID=A0ABT3QYJ2_9HYPH|nr:MlaD family protein [Roseibium sp. DSM 29163]MCX2722022.1 MlaD family protein [Roseibium sp. DSM 29163]
METRANYILIGAFMVAILISAFGFVYWLAATAESRQNVQVKIVFPGPVTGLPVGGQVLFNGIKVGDVSALGFAPEDPAKVIATVRIRPDTPLREDSKATLNFTGLTGVAYVDLSGGSSDSPLLLENVEEGETPVLYAERSFFDDIVDGARDVLKRADSTMQTVDDLLKENRPAITRIITNAETFSDALAANSAGVEDFMASIGKASESFSSLSVRMESLVEEGERLLAAVPSDKVTAIVDDLTRFSESLGNASDDIDLLLADAQGAAKELDQFTKGLNDGLEEVRGVIAAVKPEEVERVMKGAAALGVLDERSGDIDQLIVSTRQTMQNVDDIVATFKEKEGAISDMIDGGREIVLKADTIMTRGVEIATAVDPLKVEQVVSSLGSFADGLNASLTRVDELVASVDPQQVSEAVDKVSTIIDNFNNQQGQINEIIASTKSTIQNFEQVSATVRGQDDRIAALITDVQRAADRFATTLETAEGLLEAVDPEKVANIVGSVETAAADLAHPEDGVPAILKSARKAADDVQRMTADLSKRTPDVDQIITDAKQMTATLNSTSVRVESLVEKVSDMVEGDGEGLIKEATLAAQAIRKVAVAFESRADSIAGGLAKFATQGSADFASAVAQLNRTLVSFQRVAESLERNPSRVIFGGDDVPTYSGGRRR